jgi:hypothetical protein
VNISLEKFCCRKETWGYAKEKVKKRERRKKESIENNGYKDARHKKEG